MMVPPYYILKQANVKRSSFALHTRILIVILTTVYAKNFAAKIFGGQAFKVSFRGE
jgi:hypothetical protein